MFKLKTPRHYQHPSIDHHHASHPISVIATPPRIPEIVERTDTPIDTIRMYMDMMNIDTPHDITCEFPSPVIRTTTQHARCCHLIITRSGVDFDHGGLPLTCQMCVVSTRNEAVVSMTQSLVKFLSTTLRVTFDPDVRISVPSHIVARDSPCEIVCSATQYQSISKALRAQRWIIDNPIGEISIHTSSPVYVKPSHVHFTLRTLSRLAEYATDYIPGVPFTSANRIVIHLTTPIDTIEREVFIADVLRSATMASCVHVIFHDTTPKDIATLLFLLNEYCSTPGRPPLLIAGPISGEIKTCVNTCATLMASRGGNRRSTTRDDGVIYTIGDMGWEIGISLVDTTWHNTNYPIAHESTPVP